MRIHPWSPAMVAVLSAIASAPRGANAQGSIIDRAKKSMTDAANATQKGLTDEVTRQANAAVDAAASAEVADGAFNAAVSPWVGNDGAKRVELARFSGDAFAVTTSTGRQIVLCDDRGLLPWLASLQIDNNASGGRAATAGRSGARGATGQPSSGVAQAGATSRGATATNSSAKSGTTAETNGDVAPASKNGSTLPNAAEREYRLPQPLSRPER